MWARIGAGAVGALWRRCIETNDVDAVDSQ